MRKNSDITIVFDFDGVICANNGGDYINAPPFKDAIAQINQVYSMGYRVVISTARYGKRHPDRQYQEGYIEAVHWLKTHGVKYHELRMGKPAGDLYVDDKGCFVDSKHGLRDWINNFWPRLQELNKKNDYNEFSAPTSIGD